MLELGFHMLSYVFGSTAAQECRDPNIIQSFRKPRDKLQGRASHKTYALIEPSHPWPVFGDYSQVSMSM